MVLQVQRVATVISCTKTRWEKVIEKLKNAIQVQVQVRVWTQKRSNAANLMGKRGALDTINASKQQSNDTQGAVTHSRLLRKTTH